MEVCCILPEVDCRSVDSAGEAVAADSSQTDRAAPKQVFKEGADTDSAKDR